MTWERYASPLGQILLCAHGGALIGLWFEGQKYERAGCEGLAAEAETDKEVLHLALKWLDAYFAGERPKFDGVLAPRGTVFQQRVWGELQKIPYGETISYGELAGKLLCASARAVGAAVGRNPISLLIPCHRVLGADGKLTGYAGGLVRKARLLKLEGICFAD